MASFDSASFDVGSFSPLAFFIDAVEAAGGKSKKKRQEEYDKAYELALWRQRQREAILEAVEAAKTEDKHKPILRPKKKKAALEIHQDEIDRLAQIQDYTERLIAIEFILNLLEAYKRREYEALALLLLA